LRQKYLPPAGASGSREVATYDYTDRDGQLVFQVVRFEPKAFRQRRPDGRGGWLWKLDGVERVIYRLAAVIAAVSAGRTVYVAEGEKGVHALESIGVAATCSPAGAGKWHGRYNSVFGGADVVILPDNDPQATAPDGRPRWHPDGRPVLPGQDHGADVAKHLLGVADRVRILPLPGLPAKGDVADWVAAGGTAAKLEELTTLADREPSPEDSGRGQRPPPAGGEVDYGGGDRQESQDKPFGGFAWRVRSP
jgi:putative DNA primase/helicase